MAERALPGLGSVLTKVTGGKTGMSDEQRKARGDLLKLNAQFQITKSIIQKNRDKLEGLAKTDSKVADLLGTIDDSQKGSIKKLEARLMSGQALSGEQTQTLLDNLNNVTAGLEGVQVNLDTNLGDVVQNLGSMIQNDDIDRVDRRKMITDIANLASQSEVSTQLNEEQAEALKELQALQVDELNFTQEEKQNVDKLLNRLVSSKTDIIVKGSIDKLNQTVDSAIITNKELKTELEQERGPKGESLKEMLKKGLPALSGMKGGAMTGAQALLGMAGMGPLAALLPGITGAAGKGFGLAKVAGGGLLKGLRNLLDVRKQREREKREDKRAGVLRPAGRMAGKALRGVGRMAGGLLGGIGGLLGGAGKGIMGLLGFGGMGGGLLGGMGGIGKMIMGVAPLLLKAFLPVLAAGGGLLIGALIGKALMPVVQPMLTKILDGIGDAFPRILSKLPIIGKYFTEEKELEDTSTEAIKKKIKNLEAQRKGFTGWWGDLPMVGKGAKQDLEIQTLKNVLKAREKGIAESKLKLPTAGLIDEKTRSKLYPKAKATDAEVRDLVTKESQARRDREKDAANIMMPPPSSINVASPGGTDRGMSIEDNELQFVNRAVGD